MIAQWWVGNGLEEIYSSENLLSWYYQSPASLSNCSCQKLLLFFFFRPAQNNSVLGKRTFSIWQSK